MNSRSYAAVVVLWVAAAVIAVAWQLPRSQVGAPEPVDALPLLPPGERPRASFETEDTVPSALKPVAIEAVDGEWTGPGGRPFYVVSRSAGEGTYRYRQFGQAIFDLTLRLEQDERVQEPCGSCHQGAEVFDARSQGRLDDIHRNIQPVHPSQTGAQCRTCHAQEDVQRLRLERGGTVPLDQAYRLCAQCHFRQVESWAFGAHGKRLVGWRGRRVVMGCADCHDPHRPATEVRMPMAGVSLPRPLLPDAEESEEGHGGAAAGAHERPGGNHE